MYIWFRFCSLSPSYQILGVGGKIKKKTLKNAVWIQVFGRKDFSYSGHVIQIQVCPFLSLTY